MRKIAKLAIAAAIAGMAMVSQAGIVIDNFNVAQGLDGFGEPVLTDGSANGSGKYSSVNGATTDIIGGQRDLYIEKISGGPGFMTALVANGAYSYSTPATNPLTVGTAFLKWDGQNEASPGTIYNGNQAAFLATLNPTGLNNTDLKAGGNAFRIDVLDSDLGFTFGLTVFSGAFGQNWTTLLLASAAHAGGLPASSPILFADFEGATDVAGSVIGSGAFRFTSAFGAADLSDVGALLAQVNVNGSNAQVDLSIDQVITVPEPGSLALFGIAVLGLGAVRRRKQA